MSGQSGLPHIACSRFVRQDDMKPLKEFLLYVR